jgi:hypothetical protein
LHFLLNRSARASRWRLGPSLPRCCGHVLPSSHASAPDCSSNYVNADGTSPIDKVTRNFVGLALNFTPTWFQVWPGVDLSAPLTWSEGIYGNAAVLLGGSKDNGNWSAGIAADVYQKYKFQLSYNGYFGNYSTTATGAMSVPNGAFAALSDRGWVSLTFKTTF